MLGFFCFIFQFAVLILGGFLPRMRIEINLNYLMILGGNLEGI